MLSSALAPFSSVKAEGNLPPIILPVVQFTDYFFLMNGCLQYALFLSGICFKNFISNDFIKIFGPLLKEFQACVMEKGKILFLSGWEDLVIILGTHSRYP